VRAGIAIVALVVACGTGDAAAEATKRAGSDDTMRLQMMLQQLNTDKTNLAAENTKLKADLEKAKSQLDALTKERDAGAQKLTHNQQDLANTQARSDALQRGFDTLKGRFDQLVEQYRTTVGQMKDLEQDRDRLQSLAGDYDARVAACERNNDALYKSSLELIDLYEHKGVMTALLEKEPVTKLKRVELENLMDRYRSLADDMRLKDTPPTPPVPAANASAESLDRKNDL